MKIKVTIEEKDFEHLNTNQLQSFIQKIKSEMDEIKRLRDGW